MEKRSKITDKFLIKAATSYVYAMSNFKRYIEPMNVVVRNMNEDFPFIYTVEAFKDKNFWRDDNYINLRYLLVKHDASNEYALIFQGSDDSIDKIFSGEDIDWANNLSSAAHLKLENYKTAYNEFKYLRDVEGYNITSISGNSLGGGYALYIGTMESDLRVIGVNPSPPESGTKFINHGNSTILLTSTDILSRLLKTDPKRSTYGETDAFKKIYGFHPIIINRSIPYNNELNLSIGHVGDLNDTYDFIMYTYNKNSLFYNAKVIGGEKGGKFSKLLLTTLYKELKHTEYDDFVRNSIYPNLFPSTKKMLETYKYYPALSEFMTFDLSNNIISETDESLNIEDKYTFVSNLKVSLNNYYKSQKYFIDNSMSNIIDTQMNKDVVGYNSPKFIDDEIKLNLRFDLSLLKLAYDLPISVKLKFKDIISKTISDVVALNNDLNSKFRERFNYTDKQIDAYVQELYAALKTIDTLNNYIHSSLDVFKYNIEQQIISGKKLFLFNVDHVQLPIKKLPDIDHLKQLETNMMKNCMMSARESIEVDQAYINSYFETNGKLIKEILEDLKLELTLKLKFKESAVDRKKLEQIDGLSKSIDFEQFFINVSKEFETEITHLLLGDSKVITVYYNLKQMFERNEQFRIFLETLDEYFKVNFSLLQYKRFLVEKQRILDVVGSVDTIILKLID